MRLAVCAIFRNEARYLPEWLDFHRRQGVERFYLYDNNSTDDWRAALAHHADVTEAHSWPGREGAQFTAYDDCLARHHWDTRWVAFIDLDEFLFSPTCRPLPDVLDGFRWASAVAVNWRCYGTSGHEQPCAPVTANYTHRAPDDYPANRHVKSIVFPAMAAWAENPHYMRYHGRAVGEHHDPVTGAFRGPPTAELLRVNHYVTRSASEWQRKLAGPRADVNQPRAAVDLDALSEVYDPILAPAPPPPLRHPAASRPRTR